MPRPPKCRTINGAPGASLFKPAGIPARKIEEIMLKIEEFEALRLADFEGLYQDDAATSMGVSRQTFGNILTEARQKVALALVNGLALRIDGVQPDIRNFYCETCGTTWQLPCGTGRPVECPTCSAINITCLSQGYGRGGKGCGRGKRQYRNFQGEQI